MRLRGTVNFLYGDEVVAGQVAELLEIDNKLAPSKMSIRTVSSGKKVVTEIEHNKPGTFIVSLDDLIFSEKLICSILK